MTTFEMPVWRVDDMPLCLQTTRKVISRDEYLAVKGAMENVLTSHGLTMRTTISVRPSLNEYLRTCGCLMLQRYRDAVAPGVNIAPASIALRQHDPCTYMVHHAPSSIFLQITFPPGLTPRQKLLRASSPYNSKNVLFRIEWSPLSIYNAELPFPLDPTHPLTPIHADTFGCMTYSDTNLLHLFVNFARCYSNQCRLIGKSRRQFNAEYLLALSPLRRGDITAVYQALYDELRKATSVCTFSIEISAPSLASLENVFAAHLMETTQLYDKLHTMSPEVAQNIIGNLACKTNDMKGISGAISHTLKETELRIKAMRDYIDQRTQEEALGGLFA